ncbi:ABC transporter permease [Acaryochloris sp. IP29b_bin.148]|uniref:ABC transporter permease n=1 Tax=Acaryochloris sp. IP29b_bin.148 TaxID=2969218 RepID=UPI002602C755|nr:ABC transporter permease [Acaryochloris sp. IP29b_bin.148]
MLAIAPILGILDFFIWPRNVFHSETGDPQQTLMMLFVAVIIAIMVGSLSSMREIVKENDIYRRERMVCLQLWPYILSKVLTGVLVSLYQAAVFTLFKVLVVTFPGGTPVLLGIYITLLLATIGGMVMGLLVSAIAPNQNVAPLLIILVLIPQITLGGGLLPIQALPWPGQMMSHVTFSRWAFESMVTITEVGKSIATDSCFALAERDRDQLTEAKKAEQCSCLGPKLFTKCEFPGIKAKLNKAVDMPEPKKPTEPGTFPSNPEELDDYKNQVGQYKKDINTWQADYSQWKKERESAIGEGEGIINQFNNNYGRSFAVNLSETWGILGGLSGIFCLCILPIQKRKSIV